MCIFDPLLCQYTAVAALLAAASKKERRREEEEEEEELSVSLILRLLNLNTCSGMFSKTDTLRKITENEYNWHTDALRKTTENEYRVYTGNQMADGSTH